MEQCSQIDQINYKIRRLNESLSRLSNDSVLLTEKPTNPYYLKVTGEYIHDLLNIVDYTKIDVTRCNEAILNLIALAKQFKGSSRILVHIERLTVLAKEKHIQLVKYYKDIMANNPPAAINTKTTEQLLLEKQKKTEQLRKSKNSVKEMRASIGRNTYRPTYVNKPNQITDDVASDAGRDE